MGRRWTATIALASSAAFLGACVSAEPEPPAVPVVSLVVPDVDPVISVEHGLASWYGPGFDGNLTANGEIFDQDAMTAAHPDLPLPSFVQVTNLENGESVILRVNDRGPVSDRLVIDVSQGAAEQLDFIDAGIVPVRIEVLNWRPAEL